MIGTAISITIPGPGKKQAQEFLQNRDKGVLSRLTSDLQVAFGSKAAFFDEFNALKTAAEIDDNRKAFY